MPTPTPKPTPFWVIRARAIKAKAKVLFTPSAGSRARNIVRAVLPALVLLGWVHLDAAQVSAIVIATEVIFSGGFTANKEG